MKTKILISVLLFGIILTSCNKDIGIVGDKEIIEGEIQMPEINKINLMINADIEIFKSDVQEIRILAQQNIIDNISKEVVNGQWDIIFKEIVREHDGISIIIYAPNVNGVSLSGPGTIISYDTLDTQTIDILHNGDGELHYIAHCTDAQINLKGSGILYLSGSSVNQTVNMTGSGHYQAFNFISESCNITNKGSGSAQIYCDNNLTGDIRGNAKVYYKGEPTISVDIRGNAKLINANKVKITEILK
jgi:hypothetical protein